MPSGVDLKHRNGNLSGTSGNAFSSPRFRKQGVSSKIDHFGDTFSRFILFHNNPGQWFLKKISYEPMFTDLWIDN